MKILVATGLYAPEIGGPATHTSVLERELPLRNIDVVTVPFGRVRRYPKLVRHFFYMVALIKSARGASIVYALDPVSVGLPALFVAWIMRKRFIVRIAGDYAWEQAVGRYGVTQTLDEFVNNMRSQKYMVRLLGSVQRFVANHASHVVVPSNYLKRIVAKWGVSDRTISVAYNAFVPIQLTVHREQVRTMFSYSGTVIMSAGRLVPWKGFAVLIEVLANLRKKGHHVMCVIAGDGPDREYLVRHAEEYGVADAVRFVGRQPKETLDVAISGADMFVLNTGYEGLSHQLLEVMALQVPIVTTPVGGNVELIQNDINGVLVEYNQAVALEAAIVKLMHDKKFAKRLSTAAHESVQQFTVDRMVDVLCTVFKMKT